jgi:hypothetical protein
MSENDLARSGPAHVRHTEVSSCRGVRRGGHIDRCQFEETPPPAFFVEVLISFFTEKANLRHFAQNAATP